MSVSLAALRNEAGRVVGVTAVARDITEPRRAAQALRESEQQLESILNNAAEAVIVVSADGAHRALQPRRPAPVRLQREETRGLNLRQLTVELACDESAGADERSTTWLQPLMGGRREVTGRRKDGSIFPLELALSEIGMAPRPPRFTAVVRDITERKSWENRIYTLAYTDSLTGLPNRLLLRDRLEHAIAAAQRNRTLVGVLFFDLDHFKAINDSYGHHMGDELLREIAARTTGCVREIDTVSRLGGDEFVLVLPELRDAADAGAVARKLMAALSQPYHIDGHDLSITPTLGISIYPKDGTDADMLLRNADTAMYHAKESGKNDFRFYGVSTRRGSRRSCRRVARAILRACRASRRISRRFMTEALVLLATSFWLGALHAIQPGHGKTIAAAYIVGARGRPVDAWILGIFVTLSHTSGIVLVGVLASLGLPGLMPQRVELWLKIITGAAGHRDRRVGAVDASADCLQPPAGRRAKHLRASPAHCATRRLRPTAAADTSICTAIRHDHAPRP